MIEGILLSSRLDAYDQDTTQMPMETVDLLALVAEECAHYQDVVVSGQSTTIQGNPKLLRRLVRNAVENAFKYGLPPVEVRVATTGVQAGARAEIHFTDHGQGVKLDNPNDLFEPFVRAHRSQNGAGLGLSLVKKIAERHGGGARIVSPKNTAMHLVVWL
jgi:signal transduction histidine kinase